ncbi:hypothetical protein B0H10DRAFT_1944479 [Mycena sp. CBHHK59/15]|nr:hypothetical protein B0H10DRAFT_1944479 [Mycena sp. CBHHK59/15]
MDIDDCPPFIPADWIGMGKTYSGDLLVPFQVISAKIAVLEIPAHAVDLIPPPNMPVIKFVELDLPRYSSELVLGQSQIWFSKDAPTTNTSLLRNRTVPPLIRKTVAEMYIPSQKWSPVLHSTSQPFTVFLMLAVLDLLSRKIAQAWTVITAISYVSVRVFEHQYAATATAMLQTKQFAHIPSINFRCLLSKSPKVLPTGLELAQEDVDRFKKLNGGLGKFNEAMVLFCKHGKRAAATGEGSGDDVDEDGE